MNRLYYGDNLTIMQQMPAQSVDLIYLDPPFNSKKNYNLIYEQMTGKPVPAQADAFCDTWEMDAEKEEIARNMPILMREHGIENYYVEFWRLWIQALRKTQPKLLAYLIYMVQRIMQMKTLLRPTGSIYLHCDPTASHYIKIMMDGIFGHDNFRNEVIWKRTGAHSSSQKYGPIHDVILFYTKSNKYTWNRVYQAYFQDYIDANYTEKDKDGRLYQPVSLTGPGITKGESGQEWKGINPTDIGRHWAVTRTFPGAEKVPGDVMAALDYLDNIGRIHWPKTARGKTPRLKQYLDEAKGVVLQDIVTDIGPVPAKSNERIGYPTQKPVPLLKRIIQASSREGDTVFDPFCGCGTTTYAAQETGRRWIGCDIAILAVKLIKYNIEKEYGLKENKDFEIDGIPVSVEGALQLFKKDPFQFQHWAVERVDGFPTLKKVADQGIDGNIYFETEDGFKDMVISVKGGIIRPTDIRDLRGVLERDANGTVMAGFISNKEPTKAMKEEAAKAGMYTYAGRDYQRIQLLTTKDILEDKREFQTPSKIGMKQKKGQLNLDIIKA